MTGDTPVMGQNRYSLDEKFKKSTAGTTLVRLVLVFTGNDLVYIEPPRASGDQPSTVDSS
ncbi:MAG: hypothetical protein GY757_06555 [bacterium]|nr:hypothetical protein [bacterium]